MSEVVLRHPGVNLRVSHQPTGWDTVPTKTIEQVVCWCRLRVNPSPSFLLPLYIMNALKKVKKFGTSGRVFRRGQQIVLQNERTGEHVAVKVVLHDTRQGWLAENGEGDWQWYRINNEYWPKETDYWIYIKKVGT